MSKGNFRNCGRSASIRSFNSQEDRFVKNWPKSRHKLEFIKRRTTIEEGAVNRVAVRRIFYELFSYAIQISDNFENFVAKFKKN